MQLSIVSYLDPEASAKIRKLQREVSEVTGSQASLSSWQPHITLGDGVEVTNLELDEFKDEIQEAAQSTTPFSINITGFRSLSSRPIGVGEVSTPYAIFINAVASQELLELVSRIENATIGRSIWYQMPQPFLPHVTLAFRDLTEAGYNNGLEYLSDKNIVLSSVIDHVALVQKYPDSDIELIRIPLAQF
jgi:2'-5' RNA ligase